MAKYRASSSYNSHASHGQRMGAGPVAGAPVVVAGGPGGGKTGARAAGGHTSGDAPGVEKAASGKAPKGMDVYKEGS